MAEDSKRKSNLHIKWIIIGCSGLVIITVVFVALIMGISIRSLFITIGPDERGVLISPYETSGYGETPLTPGNHFIRPGETVDIYNISRVVYSSSSEGACHPDEPSGAAFHTLAGEDIVIEFELIYVINSEQIVQMHQNWGHYYECGYVIPTSKQVIEEVASRYSYSDIALNKRDEINQAIFSSLDSDFTVSGFILQRFEIESVLLK